MHIVLNGLSPKNILLIIIHAFCSCSLSVQLPTNCCQELVANCSQNSNRTFVSLWHRFCIFACEF